MKIDLGITEIREIVRNGKTGGISKENYEHLKKVFIDSFREYDGKYVLYRNVHNGTRMIGKINCDEGDAGNVVFAWDQGMRRINALQLYDIEVVEVLKVLEEDEEEHKPIYEFPPMNFHKEPRISPSRLIGAALEASKVMSLKHGEGASQDVIAYIGLLSGCGTPLTPEIMTEEMVDSLDEEAQALVYAYTCWSHTQVQEFISPVTGHRGRESMIDDLIATLFPKEGK